MKKDMLGDREWNEDDDLGGSDWESARVPDPFEGVDLKRIADSIEPVQAEFVCNEQTQDAIRSTWFDDYIKARGKGDLVGVDDMRPLFRRPVAASGERRPVGRRLFGDLWHEGELAVCFAGHGMGKSVLAAQISESIARGRPLTRFGATSAGENEESEPVRPQHVL
jgi:hypothetical protein